MTAEQLITFAAVAEYLNISQAARALHLSQPAVSGQLRQLQAAFGEPLYVREGRGVQLTPVGRQLAHYAAQMREANTRARAYRDSVRGLEQGLLRIGASTTPASYLLPYLIAAFRRERPGIEVEIMSGNTAEVVAALDTLDLALIEGPPGTALPRSTVSHAWREDEIVMIAPPAHRLARWPGVPVALAELGGEPLVLREHGSGLRQVVEQAFEHAAVPMQAVYQVAGVEAVKEAVRAGMGIGFVSAMSLRHEDAALVMRPLAPTPLTRRFSILVTHGDAPSRAAARFVEICLAWAG
jgi:LysR family transcriptional regulator, low CO2-responsive transcriptional regulator